MNTRAFMYFIITTIYFVTMSISCNKGRHDYVTYEKPTPVAKNKIKIQLAPITTDRSTSERARLPSAVVAGDSLDVSGKVLIPSLDGRKRSVIIKLLRKKHDGKFVTAATGVGRLKKTAVGEYSFQTDVPAPNVGRFVFRAMWDAQVVSEGNLEVRRP